MHCTKRLLLEIHWKCGAILNRMNSFYAAKTLLDSENLNRTASMFGAVSVPHVNPTASGRKAAVLIPLCEHNEKVSLLFTLRTSFMRSHKGQVSFPGGMQDAMDKSLRDTALRETNEELGIKPSQIRIWGEGQPIVPRGATRVVPILGTISKVVDLSKLKLNPQEVQVAFTVPIEELCRTENVHYTQFKGGYTTPCFIVGDKRIWGLTAVITHIFLKCLLPRTGYKPRIKFDVTRNEVVH